MKFLDLIKNKLSFLPGMWILLFIVAAWSILNQGGSINRDGLGYLEQATYFINGEWKEGFLFYPWPFFSLLLTILYFFTHLPLQILAHIICLILFGIAVYYFLRILQFITRDRDSVFYGGLILISSIPIMDDYVGMILRDHGLWAACMAGTYFYIIDQKNPTLHNSLKWQFSFFIGGFFRPESFIFLILLPLWHFVSINKKNLSIFLINYLLLISIFIVFSLFVMFSDNAFELITNSRLSEIIYRPVTIIEKLFSPIPIISEDPMLKILIDSHKIFISVVTMFSIIFIKWFYAVGYLNSFIFLYGLSIKKIKLNPEIYKNIIFFLLLSFFIVSVNTYYVYVLSNRYWVFHLWWIFLIVVPIFINLIRDEETSGKVRFLIWAGIFVSFFNIIFDKGDDLEMIVANYVKTNLKESVDFGDFERISYYINYDPFTFKDYHQIQDHKYKLIKSEQMLDELNIIKKFPEDNPKFILISND